MVEQVELQTLQLHNHVFSFSVTAKKWLGSFGRADDSCFPQILKPFVLPPSSPFPHSPPIPCSYCRLLPLSCATLLLPFLCLWLPLSLSFLFSTCLISPVAFFLSCGLFSPSSTPLLISGVPPNWKLSLLFLVDSLHYYYSILLFQAMWMRAKAHWWATCFFCWAMWTSAPCTSTSRNQRRRERPRSLMRGCWMKLARRGTGTLRGMEIWIFTSPQHSSEFLCCALQMQSLHLSAVVDEKSF